MGDALDRRVRLTRWMQQEDDELLYTPQGENESASRGLPLREVMIYAVPTVPPPEALSQSD
ncbi:MAG: hypothetical protein AB7N91_26375 [Candidatus Tectimicrobiota bacterium]